MSREMERRMERIEAALATPLHNNLRAWILNGGDAPPLTAACAQWLAGLSSEDNEGASQ